MRILVLAFLIFAVTQQDRAEARDLGICNGLNFKACAEAFFRSNKSLWLSECKASKINSPDECLAEMVKCISTHETHIKEKYQNEQSVLQGEFEDEEDIQIDIGMCISFR